METIKEKIMNKLRDLIKINLSTEEQAAIASFKPAVVEVVAVKAMEVKTKDGAITLSYEGEVLAVNSPVMDITTGTPIPALDGEYTLEDDTVITVVGSVVTEISTPEAEVAETPEQMAAKKAAAESQATQMAEIESLKKANVLMSAQLSAMNKTMEALLETPVTGGKIGENAPLKKEKSFDEMTPLEKFQFNKYGEIK